MGFWASFANVWKDCSFYLKISAEIWSTVLQMGLPEIDMQTIDNLGRTLIDVARYCYHFFSIEVLYFSESGWNNVWQTFSTDCIYRDSHPLLVPVLQKKKCSKSGKKISKERSREISWSVLILYLCICKTQIQLIMLSFQFRLKDDRDIDDLLSFIEGPCSKVTNEKKKKVKKSAK